MISASDLSDSVRERLASHLSGDTWRHLAQLLDLDYMVPSWAKESSPAELLLHPDIMKVSLGNTYTQEPDYNHRCKCLAGNCQVFS